MTDIRTKDLLERIAALIDSYAHERMAQGHSEGYDEGFADQADATMAAFDNGYDTAMESIVDAKLTYDDGYAAALDATQEQYDKGYADGIAASLEATNHEYAMEMYDQGYADGEDAGLEQTSQAGFEHGYQCAKDDVNAWLDDANK